MFVSIYVVFVIWVISSIAGMAVHFRCCIKFRATSLFLYSCVLALYRSLIITRESAASHKRAFEEVRSRILKFSCFFITVLFGCGTIEVVLSFWVQFRVSRVQFIVSRLEFNPLFFHAMPSDPLRWFVSHYAVLAGLFARILIILTLTKIIEEIPCRCTGFEIFFAIKGTSISLMDGF